MQIVLLTFLYFLLWLSLSIVLSLLVIIYIELAWVCPQLGVNDSQPNQVGTMDKCFEFGGNPSEMITRALRAHTPRALQLRYRATWTYVVEDHYLYTHEA